MFCLSVSLGVMELKKNYLYYPLNEISLVCFQILLVHKYFQNFLFSFHHLKCQHYELGNSCYMLPVLKKDSSSSILPTNWWWYLFLMRVICLSVQGNYDNESIFYFCTSNYKPRCHKQTSLWIILLLSQNVKFSCAHIKHVKIMQLR